jgi:hypothetical protein
VTDHVWPNGVRMSAVTWRLISNTERTPAQFTGGMQTATRPGDRLACRVTVEAATGSERRALVVLANRLRGSGNRLYLPDYAFRRAGAWSGGEKFSNTEFASTSGWSTSGSVLSVAEGVMRVAASGGGSAPHLFQSVAAGVANYPFALRSMLVDGPEAAGLTMGQALNISLTTQLSNYSTSRGYRVLSGVVTESGGMAQYSGLISATSGYTKGAYFEVPFTSFAQCMLVDGGGNRLLRSNEMQTSWTQSGLSAINSNVITAPDGTVTGDRLVENSATASHGIYQSGSRENVGADLCAYGSFARDSGTRNVQLWVGNDGSNGGYASFNLSNGAVSGVATSGTASNPRAFAVDAGNGWWRCYVVARLPAADTIATYADMADASMVVGYTGNGSSSIGAWGVGALISGVPTRGSTTTNAAVDAQSHAAGVSAIYVKGGPVGMQGALLAGDPFELDGLMRFATSSLDFDDSGLGYLEFAPALARAVADNTPIIVHNPMSRMVMTSDAEFSCRPGGVSDFEFEFEQDLQT